MLQRGKDKLALEGAVAMKRLVGLGVVAALVVGLLGCAQEAGSPEPVSAEGAWMAFEAPLGTGTFEEVRSFGDNPGALKMYRYTPPDVPANAGLMVAMHPCTLNATSYRNAGFESVADEYKFHILYPEQQSGNNPLSCFNWAGEYGDPTNLRRGEGENASIISMVRKMEADFSIDSGRIFAAGHSGGGAQAALMMATWPDVFSGGAMFAGIAYNCTTTFSEVSGCLNPGRPQSADEWGRRAREGFPGYNGPWPKISVWTGTADNIVAPVNATELVEQWTNVHGIDAVADFEDQIDGHAHAEYRNSQGETMVELYQIQGAGHGTFVDPDSGCGSTGAYLIDSDICAAYHAARFFGLTDDDPVDPGDREAPTVSFGAPSNGMTVSGSVQVSVTASDNVAVARVELSVNGQPEATLSAAPFNHTWDTSALANGGYALRAVAFDAAGNNAEATLNVTVSGGVEDTTPPTVSFAAPTEGMMVSGAVQVTANATDDFGVRRVVFMADGNPIGESETVPYQVSWDSASAGVGAHVLTARAEDAAGNTAEAMVNVSVTDAPVVSEPVITFVSPTMGSTVSGLIRVTVNADDPDGMDQALLFVGEDLSGADYAPPFEFLLDTAILPEGPATLTVRAFDNTGTVGLGSIDVVVSRDGGDNPMTPGNPENPGEEGPVRIGKSFWGCQSATTGGPVSGGAVWFGLGLVALGFALRRRKAALVVGAAVLLVGCGGDDIFITADNNGTGNPDVDPDPQPDGNPGVVSIESQSDVFAFLEGKTMLMAGVDLPTHNNGFLEDVNFGQATQCYTSVEISQLSNRWTVRSQLGTLNDAPETGDVGMCDRMTPSGAPLEFVSTAVLIENVRDNGGCFDVTATYPGFGQEGRAAIASDGKTILMELFFKDQATGHRCADGEVGSSTVTLNNAAFEGDAVQTYQIQ